jgi:hypothetical protein
VVRAVLSTGVLAGASVVVGAAMGWNDTVLWLILAGTVAFVPPLLELAGVTPLRPDPPTEMLLTVSQLARWLWYLAVVIWIIWRTAWGG